MKRFSDEQSIGFLREAEVGVPVKGPQRQRGFSKASYFQCRSRSANGDLPKIAVCVCDLT